MRFDVNALARSLALSLSRQPLGEGERLVRFDVNALALSLSLATVWHPVSKGEMGCDVNAHRVSLMATLRQG